MTCLSCPRGQDTANRTGAAECSQCDLGKYGDRNGSCTTCDPGLFQDGKGATSCTTCPPSKVPNDARTACESPTWKVPTDCKPNTECLDDRDSDQHKHACMDCPLGGDCSEPDRLTTLVPLSGFRGYSWAAADKPFAKCPFASACPAVGNGTCAEGYESDEAVAPLCATCVAGYTFGAEGCEPCTAENLAVKIGTLVAFVLIVTVVIVSLRRRLQKLRSKYGKAWRDVLMVFSVNVTYAQVGSSFADLFSADMPDVYLGWLSQLRFMHFDVLSMLGGNCLGEVGFELKFLATASTVVAIIGFVALAYCLRARGLRSRLRSLQEANIGKHLLHLFETVDLDRNGTINVAELDVVCTYMRDLSGGANTTKDERRKEAGEEGTAPETAADMMKRLGGTDGRLTAQQFVDAVASGKLRAGPAGDLTWARKVEQYHLRSTQISVAVQLLLLVHAPVSQKVFFYFNAHNLSGRQFLKSDYRIRVFEPRWNAFLPVVIVLGICFTMGLPIYVLGVLMRHRKVLHTLEIRQVYGFLCKFAVCCCR